jgi:malonyl-CoA O-methyltransferase
MLLRAQAEYPYLAQANLITLPFAAATFDFVVCGLALGHIPDLSAALSELARVLKPQGMLFYSDVHPLGALAGWQRTFEVQGQTYTMPHHIHLYQDHLAAYRAASLVVEDVREPRLGADTPAPGWPAALVVRAKKPKGRGFDPDV